MIDDAWPLFTKGWIGFLALFFLIACIPQDELVAKPTEKISSAVVQELSENEPIKSDIQSTGAVSLDEPRPKIDPKLVEELKELKKQKKHKRVKVLIEVKDEKSLERLQDIIDESDGKITEIFSVGDVAVAEIYSDKIEEIAQAAGVEQVAAEREYIAFVEDRITAFSIDEVWENNITGNGVRIAILDTGVGPHDAINVKTGKSFVSAEDEKDQNGHGTHVAGIAQKVAKDAVIYNAKVLSKTGGGTTSQILAGINWAVNPDGDDSTDDSADIISMSFGGLFTELDGPLASAVKEAIQNGVIFVAASGNCKQGCGGFYGVTTPGNVKEVIAVGAVDDSNNIASFSSGDTFDGYVKPDIVAPGVDISSAWLNNGEKTLSGTSMSTPFVSGVIALMLEKESLTQEQAKKKLVETAKDLGDEGWDTRYGAGVVDVGKLFSLTITELNKTENNATVPEINTSTASPELSEADTIAPYDGFYVTNPINFNAFQSADIEESTEPENYTAAAMPSEVKIKIPEGSINTVFTGQPFVTSSEKENPLEALATGQGYIDYDDDFTYQSSSNDGIAWDGNYLDVGLDGEESSTKVICFDWCDDGTWDHCFADTKSDFDTCYKDSSSLSSICSGTNKCWYGGQGRDYDHIIDTTNPGYRWTCNVDARSYAKCGTSNYNYYDVSAKPYYIVDPRQYDCNSAGGTYDDIGKISSTQQVRINKDVSCGSTKGCDDNKDDGLADFGSKGTSAPSAPCSLKNGYSDCDYDSDCLSGHCSCVGTGCNTYDLQSDYCCPTGQEWDGSKCATPGCTMSSAGWSTTSAQEGATVTLTVNGDSNCDGKTATFKIYEHDCGYDYSSAEDCTDETVSKNPSSATFSNGKATTTWKTEWQDDGILGYDPEYYFIATADSKTLRSSSDLSVSKGCADSDGDTYGNPGSSACAGGTTTDCDDSNASIKPGATEICDSKDNNCDGNTDENNVCQTCTAQYTGNVQCSGNTPQKEYQYSDCSKSWINQPACGSGTTCQNGNCVSTNTCTDNDGDGYGNPGSTVCSKGSTSDCDDSNNKKYPGNTEVCDSYDNDCDGSTNEGNVCCGNTVCDNGETSNTCLKDCPKSCSKNSDCPSGAWCGFIGLIGTCKTTLCQSTCTNNAYSCISDSVYQCKDGNNDGCYENIFYKQCGPGLCENGKSSCLTTTPSTKITIEEAEGTIVNVQKGDIITANLKYTKDETIELQYDSVFALDTSTCSSSFTIKGSKQCRFTVSSSANPGKYKIGLKNGQQTTVKVVSNPSVIILTNKPKLYIRFNNAGVYDLLKQAYSYADGKQAVVYDLDDYLIGHPWSKLDDYKEEYADQQLKDNAYSLEVSQFIAEKCNECSTLILGDDFVVPHYRRDLDMSAWFGLSQKTDETYSDIAYIQRTSKTFAEFEELFYQKDKFDGKNVLVVLPDNVDTAKRKEIDKLKSFLENHAEIKAKISEKNASDVVCNSKQAFSYYDGYTLIIVGTSKTNRALNCFPFVIENDLETITIERNPWDGRAYAIVVNSDNTDLLTSLNGLLDNGTYKQLDSSGWLIARTTANVAAGIAIGSLALGASPVVLLIAGAASVAADSIDGAECWKFKGSECTEFVVGLAIPLGAEKVGKPLIKSAIDIFGPRLRYLYEIHGEGIIGAIKKMNKRGALAPGSKTGKYFKSLTDEFDVRTIKKYLSKEEADIAQEGTELLGDEFSLALKDFEPKLPKEHRLNLLKYAGNSEQAIRYAYQNFNEIWVPFVPKKGTFLFRGDNAYSYNPSKSYPGIHRIAEFVPLEEHAFKNVFNALIPTTKDLTVAAQHAVKRATSGATFETYILVINPRALNGIDIDTSYYLTHGSQLNFLESEVGVVSNVNTREIVGVIKGKVSYLDGSVISRFKPEKFEPNPAYVADSSNPFDYKKAMEALK